VLGLPDHVVDQELRRSGEDEAETRLTAIRGTEPEEPRRGLISAQTSG